MNSLIFFLVGCFSWGFYCSASQPSHMQGIPLTIVGTCVIGLLFCIAQKDS